MEGERYAGSFGEAGIFSFQQSKCLASGEGGIILTDSDEFAELAWSLRHYGRTKRGLWYEHHRLGWNGRMTEFCGALLRTQLRKLPSQNARRMENVAYFCERLRDVEGLRPVRLHPRVTQRNHYLLMLRYDAAAWDGLPRERFIEALGAEGVPASAGYSFLNFENPVLSQLPLTAKLDYGRFAESCPNAVRACRQEAVWLVHQLFLGDRRDVDMIVEAILKVRDRCRDLLEPAAPAGRKRPRGKRP
jgi:dTDP-4-amino-4,6-dideoxygalactose transaminase